MLGVRLEPELEARLEKLARKTGRSKSYYAKEAIRRFLEDCEDYLLGLAALERNESTVSLEELQRRLVQAREAADRAGKHRDLTCRWASGSTKNGARR